MVARFSIIGLAVIMLMIAMTYAGFVAQPPTSASSINWLFVLLMPAALLSSMFTLGLATGAWIRSVIVGIVSICLFYEFGHESTSFLDDAPFILSIFVFFVLVVGLGLIAFGWKCNYEESHKEFDGKFAWDFMVVQFMVITTFTNYIRYAFVYPFH